MKQAAVSSLVLLISLVFFPAIVPAEEGMWRPGQSSRLWQTR